jgi:anaerobic magnesium-protoporphyrin IX monomethyl ester cyclase
LKVTLCYPALIPGHKPKYGLQPLGVLYIAALLKREGFDVEVIDADVDGLTVQETADRILATQPDLVGFSMMTPQLITGLAAAALVKQARPGLLVGIGGAHIDSTKEDTFAMADCFEFAVHGEGEYTLLEICQNIEKYGTDDLERCFAEVPNAIYRAGEMREVVVNPPRMFLKELDELPSVDFDMLDIKKYSIPTMAGSYVASMMLSRGCPFKCTFCDAPITMGTKLRFWSIPRVLEDIRFYKEKYGVTNFVFKDSTFTAKKRWAFEFCQALIDSGLDIKWRCNTRANLVPPELLELMAKAGCYVINFGVESGHPEILKRIKKEVDLEEVRDAHERCRKLGIRTYATFLMGNPGETAETAQTTIDFSKTIRPSLGMFFVSTAYPGTPMYDEAVVDGSVEERWWAKQEWDASKNSAFEVRWGWTDAGALKIPGFDTEAWQKKATREFYLRPRFIWDTLVFTVKNPYFIRHIWNLGTEILPFYKLRNLFPGGPKTKQLPRDGCPSLPNPGYAPREGTELRTVTQPQRGAEVLHSGE